MFWRKIQPQTALNPQGQEKNKDFLKKSFKNIWWFKKNCLPLHSHLRDNKCDALVAQLVEHLTLNQRVQGSNPCRRTKGTSKRLIIKAFFRSPLVFCQPFVNRTFLKHSIFQIMQLFILFAKTRIIHLNLFLQSKFFLLLFMK